MQARHGNGFNTKSSLQFAFETEYARIAKDGCVEFALKQIKCLWVWLNFILNSNTFRFEILTLMEV